MGRRCSDSKDFGSYHCNAGSRRIQTSLGITGLSVSVLEEALRQSEETNQSEMEAWLMIQMQREGRFSKLTGRGLVE